MENTAEKIETEGFYAREYGLNVDVPKGMTDVDFKDYTYNLNRGMTQEDRIKYYKKPISWEEGQLIAKRSKDNPEDTSLLSEIWEDTKNVAKMGWNQSIDLATSLGEAVDVGVSSVALSAMPDQEKARQTLINQLEAYNEVKDKIKLDTSTAGEISSGLSSVGLSTMAGAATYGHPILNTAFVLSFGTSNYLDNLETMLKQGASIKEANTRALTGGILEVASEKAGLKIAGRYTNTLLKKYGARFGIESIQELWQDTKDEVILGKYDTRTEEQKAKSSVMAMFFGGLGGAIGFAINDVSTRTPRKNIETKAKESGYTESEAKQIGLSVLDEDGAEQRKEIQAKAIERAKEQITETRSQLYDKFIEKGDSAEIAAEKAQMLVPDYELMKKDVESLVKEGFSEEEKENLKQSYLEAVNSAGEEAGLYLAANEEIRNLIQKAGRSEQEAKDYAAYMTGLMIKDYQILKDTGFEGTFEDVKEKFYKLNKITDYEYEAWAEYDARNQTEYNEEQDMMEGKPSHKLFSKTITNNKGDKRVYVNPQKSELSQILDNKSQRVLINKETGKYYSIDADNNIHFDIIETLAEANKDGLTQDDIKDHNSRIETYYNKYDAIYLTKNTVDMYEGHHLIYTSDWNFSHYKMPSYDTLEGARKIYDDYKSKSIGKFLGEFDELATVRGLIRRNEKLLQNEEESLSIYNDMTIPPSKLRRMEGYRNNIAKLQEQENELLANSITVSGSKLTTRKDGYKVADDNDVVDVVYLPKNVVPDFNTKRELVKFIKTLLGNERNITIKSTGENVFISNRGIERGASKTRSAEYNEAFGAVRQLLENAKYSGFVIKDEKHSNVRGQDVYHSGLVIGDRPYSVMFKIDIPEGEASHNYAGHKISDIEIAPTSDNGGQVTIPTKTEVDAIRNITLAVLRGKVNPARKKNGKLYSKTQGEAIGSYDELTREVELFKGQNPSTLMHELSHHFLLNHLNLMESMGLKDRNSEVFKFLSEVGGHEINSVNDMTDVDKENLTEAFINYMNTNEAPNLATKSIFQRAKEWVIDQYRIHQTDASPEIREYFDGLISRESAMPDVSSMVNRTAEIREILKQAINGEQVSFKGLGKKELEQLQKALHTRIRRKGKSLRDELIEAGGIKEGTELAKALGFDVLKKDKMFSTKETAIETEQELIDWLTEKGYIVGVQEGESYSDTERRWEEVLSLIDNAENTYTVKESMINNERETAIRNQAHAQEIVDELLKDNALGLKDIHDLDNLLTRTISKKDDVDIIKVNTNAVRYLNERMRSLTKDTKELLRNKDKEFKSKREEQYQAQNDLKDFIRNLPINGKHKVSLMGNIQRVKDYDSLQKVVNEIKPRVQGFIEQEIKTLLSNKIDAIVRSSKPKERKKQKFNYEYNTFFEELREINKLTKEQAQDKLKEIFEMLGEDVEFDGTDLLKNMFLTYKSNGMNSSVELMKQLSDELDNIYNEALQDRMDTLERLGQEREAKIKEAVDYIENTKAVNKLNQKLLKITNLNSNLSELFGKKWADKHKMDSLLIKQDMETNKALDDVIREGKDIYGLKNREEFVKLANDMRVTKEEYTLNNYRDDMSEQISKMQIMDIYLTIKNKGSAEAYRRLYEDFDELGNQTTTQIEDLLSYLTEEDKKFADMLQKRVNDLYKAENKVYVKLYGIDMPKHENYWMRTSDRAERPLMDIKQFMNVDMIPSFMKERSKVPSVRPDDVFKKFARRIHDSKYMTEVFEQYKDIYDLVHSNRVKKAIVKKYDNDRYKVLNQSLKRISLGGVNDSYNELNNMLGKAITNWVVSKISISETVFIKQLASFTNYMENVPVSDFAKYEAEFWANPKEAVGFMKNFAGEYLDHRFKSGIQNEVLQRIMQSKPEEYSKATGAYQKYLNFVTAPVRFGDIGAIYLGGYARARYLLEQGVPLEQARKMFIEETESAQQSGNKAELSEFQHNALWRVFTAFKNTNLQYMRKMQDSYIQFTRGEISAQQFGKTWGNYMVIQSVLYQVLTNIGTWWRDDDDEELDWFKDVWMRILTAPVAGFPIIGDITEGVFAENYWGLNISGKQDMEAFIGAARDAIDGEYDAKKIAKGSMSLISFFRPIPDRMIKGVINLVED